MKGEIPVCKRCCCCFPLRYGLLVWGYFKMTADLFMIALTLYALISIAMMTRLFRPDGDILSRLYDNDIVLMCIILAVFIADFMATIFFIVGGHKKNLKLIELFYYISIVMDLFSCLVTITYIILTIKYNINWQRNIVTISFYFLVVVVQTYFLILLRSEITKLQNVGEFRFVNNAAEAECTMTCEEIVTGEEAGRGDV